MEDEIWNLFENDSEWVDNQMHIYEENISETEWFWTSLLITFQVM